MTNSVTPDLDDPPDEDEAAAMLGVRHITMCQWPYQRCIRVVKLLGRLLRFR